MISVKLIEGLLNVMHSGKEIEQNSFTELVSPLKLRGAAMDLQSLVRSILPSSRNKT